MIDEEHKPLPKTKCLKIVINGFFNNGKKIYIDSRQINKKKHFAKKSNSNALAI